MCFWDFYFVMSKLVLFNPVLKAHRKIRSENYNNPIPVIKLVSQREGDLTSGSLL